MALASSPPTPPQLGFSPSPRSKQAASPQHPSPTRKTQPRHPPLLPTCPEVGGGLLCGFPSPKKQSRETCPETGAAPRSTASSAGVPFPPESDAPVRGVPRHRLLPEESSPKSWLGGCAGALAKPRAPWWGKELSGESPRIPGFCEGEREVNAERNRPIRGRSVALEAAETLALVGWRGAEAREGPRDHGRRLKAWCRHGEKHAAGTESELAAISQLLKQRIPEITSGRHSPLRFSTHFCSNRSIYAGTKEPTHPALRRNRLLSQ